MIMKLSRRMRAVLVVLAGLGPLMLTAGCDRIHEPWLQNPDQLAQERARPEQAAEALRDRLIAVQTDR